MASLETVGSPRAISDSMEKAAAGRMAGDDDGGVVVGEVLSGLCMARAQHARHSRLSTPRTTLDTHTPFKRLTTEPVVEGGVRSTVGMATPPGQADWLGYGPIGAEQTRTITDVIRRR